MPAESRLNHAADNISDAAEKAADAVSSAEHHASDKAERSFNDAARRIEKAVHEGLEALRSRSGDVGERFDVAQRVVADQVKERPWTSTLTALGVGFLVGLLVAGSRNR